MSESIILPTDEVFADEDTGMVVYMGMEYTPEQARDLASQLYNAASLAEEILDELEHGVEE